MQRIRSERLLWILLCLALLGRFWELAEPGTYLGDEALNVPAAANYVRTGHMTPDQWYHPPLKHILLFAGMRIFGDHPAGWRMRNALCGSLAVCLLYLLARRVLQSSSAGLFAAFLLAIDPLHIAASRTTCEEIPAVLFFLAACYVLLVPERRSRWLVIAAGGMLGLALAVKWYFIVSLPVLAWFVIAERLHLEPGNRADVVMILLSLFVVPLGVYLLAYIPWFGRGYSLPEFLQYQLDALTELRTLTRESFIFRGQVERLSPAEWFIKPIVIVFHAAAGNEKAKYEVAMNAFPALLLSLPALALAAFRSWKRADRPLLLMVALFLSVYVPFLTTERPFFLYSLLPLLPFAYIAIAGVLFTPGSALVRSERRQSGVALVLFCWSLYLFPLVRGAAVPPWLYEPVLRLGNAFL